ncbi:MAG TPA: SRPBCC family protein, partial [Acidimicrobiales bacterium]|nr:SRPBCC family protein [Acidimicrobiales bacterium]
MDVTATLEAPCSREELFECVSDLTTYPKWLDIVPRAAAVDGAVGDEHAWTVELRGRLGPFARAKRLRMVRTRHDVPDAVVFERRELDGRSHSPWRLEAHVAGVGNGTSRLTMRLHYGGGLWGPLVERLLSDEIERS